MKEAIEQLQKDLELDLAIARSRIREGGMSEVSIGYWHAVEDKCGYVITRLKAVSEDEAHHSRQTPNA